MRFSGTAYRAHDPRWSFLPTSGKGAANYGGRFNPIGVPALYLSLDPMVALREASQNFGRKIQPHVLCSYDVDCDDVVDLSDDEGRRIAGIAESVLSAGWFDYIAAGVTPPQWALVHKLMLAGAAGALVPSFAPEATPADRNLVLWRWGPDLPHKVEVFDPSGRLPKNRLSWDA